MTSNLSSFGPDLNLLYVCFFVVYMYRYQIMGQRHIDEGQVKRAKARHEGPLFGSSLISSCVAPPLLPPHRLSNFGICLPFFHNNVEFFEVVCAAFPHND